MLLLRLERLDAGAARREVLDAHRCVIPERIEGGNDRKAVALAHLLDAHRAAVRLQRRQHALDQLRAAIGPQAGNPAMLRARLRLRPHHHRFQQHGMRAGVDRQPQCRLLSHLQRMPMLDARTIRRDVAHRHHRRAEMARQRRLEEKALGSAQIACSGFVHDRRRDGRFEGIAREECAL